MDEKGNTESIYDAITTDSKSFPSDDMANIRSTTNEQYNMDSSYFTVADNTYEGLNRNISINRTYDTLQQNQDQKQEVRKNVIYKYLIVSIISFLVGSVLTGSIVFAVMKYVSSNSLEYPKPVVQGDEMKLNLKLDRSTLHSTKFMSEDGVILSNIYSKQTPISGPRELDGDNAYKGASSNTYVENNDVIYYEVAFEYTLNKVLSSTNLILEVGLAQRDHLIRNYFVGNVKYGWSFAVARCGGSNNNICIRARHSGGLFVNKKIKCKLTWKHR